MTIHLALGDKTECGIFPFPHDSRTIENFNYWSVESRCKKCVKIYEMKKSSQLNTPKLWEYWIMNNGSKEDLSLLTISSSSHDKLCDIAVSSYNLDSKSRKSDLKDRVQYFILWWSRNNSMMSRYRTLQSLGDLLKRDHATVLHHLRKRKPTLNYDKNTECIKDLLES